MYFLQVLLLAVSVFTRLLCLPAAVPFGVGGDYDGDDVSCVIEDHYKSPFVSAQLSSPVPVSGCASRELTPSTHREVHVVNMHQSDRVSRIKRDSHRKHINLLIKAAAVTNSDDHINVNAVIILASKGPLVWKLHCDRLINLTADVWVSNNSQLVTHDRRIRLNIHREDLTTNTSLLASWTRQKFSALTTLTAFNTANAVTTHVAATAANGGVTAETCQNVNAVLSNAEVYNVRGQIIKGCISRTDSNANKMVHILELQSRADESLDVTVNIYSKQRTTNVKHLVLILKGNELIRWHIVVQRLRCSLDIITDGSVNSDRIVDVEPFRVVSERMRSYTGQELIEWSSEKYGQPTSYSQAQSANQFDITIDGDRNRDRGLWKSQHLRRIISTSLSITCSSSSVEVAIPRRSVERYGLSSNDLTLLNSMCRATMNTTHFVLTSNNSECGTTLVVSNESVVHKNAILVHYLADSGDTAGHDSTPPSDGPSTATVTESRLTINFSCFYPVGPVTAITGQYSPEPVAALQVNFRLFRDEQFRDEILVYPAPVELNRLLYVEASVSDGLGAGLMLRNCSVDPVTNGQMRHSLIRPGCQTTDDVKWLTEDNWRSSETISRRQRFTFLVDRRYFLPDATAVNVRCDVTLCRLDSSDDIENFPDSVPMCTSRERYCLESDATPSNTESLGITASLFKGPFTVKSTGSSMPATDSSGLIQIEASKSCETHVVVDGINSGIVVIIAFAAFAIGVLLMSSLWCIYVHTGPMAKRKRGVLRSTETSGELTPSSTVGAITARHISPR